MNNPPCLQGGLFIAVFYGAKTRITTTNKATTAIQIIMGKNFRDIPATIAPAMATGIDNIHQGLCNQRPIAKITSEARVKAQIRMGDILEFVERGRFLLYVSSDIRLISLEREEGRNSNSFRLLPCIQLTQ